MSASSVIGKAPSVLHGGVECDSWSALGNSKRDESNFFMGYSADEYEGNANLQHFLALCYMARPSCGARTSFALLSNPLFGPTFAGKMRPHVVLMFENPGYEQGLVKHPLIRYVPDDGLMPGRYDAWCPARSERHVHACAGISRRPRWSRVAWVCTSSP